MGCPKAWLWCCSHLHIFERKMFIEYIAEYKDIDFAFWAFLGLLAMKHITTPLWHEQHGKNFVGISCIGVSEIFSYTSVKDIPHVMSCSFICASILFQHWPEYGFIWTFTCVTYHLPWPYFFHMAILSSLVSFKKYVLFKLWVDIYSYVCGLTLTKQLGYYDLDWC